jgi:hypothetical protein
LSIRFLNLLTSESLIHIITNLKNLSGLDIAGCFSMDLQALSKCRSNTSLKCLILDYLPVKQEHILFLSETQIETLSLFYCQTMTDLHLRGLANIKTLTQVNIQRCNNITEPEVYEMLKEKKGDKIKNLKVSNNLLTERITQEIQ